MNTRHDINNALTPEGEVQALEKAIASGLAFEQGLNGAWYFKEKIHNGWGQFFEVKKVLYHATTAFQTLTVFESTHSGKVMLLDNAVQVVETDWRAYQEHIAISCILPQYINSFQSPDVLKHPHVLILGGGDGGVATTIRKLFPNANITMVEIDAAVIAASIKYFPDMSKALSEAPTQQFKLIIGDAKAFVADSNHHHQFDAIIIDCTDPFEGSPAARLFNLEFHTNAQNCLKEYGIILQQSGTLDQQLLEVQETLNVMNVLYDHPFITTVSMPTYPGTMALVGGSHAKITAMSLRTLQERFSDLHHLDELTDHFDPVIFHATLNRLPPVYQRILSKLLIQQPPLKSFAGTPHSLMPHPAVDSSILTSAPVISPRGNQQ